MTKLNTITKLSLLSSLMVLTSTVYANCSYKQQDLCEKHSQSCTWISEISWCSDLETCPAFYKPEWCAKTGGRCLWSEKLHYCAPTSMPAPGAGSNSSNATSSYGICDLNNVCARYIAFQAVKHDGMSKAGYETLVEEFGEFVKGCVKRNDAKGECNNNPKAIDWNLVSGCQSSTPLQAKFHASCPI